VKLIDKVYCKGSELAPALALSSQATHLARRLIVGVFKPSGYLNATFTGQASRAHKNKKTEISVKSLNEVAKNEILGNCEIIFIIYKLFYFCFIFLL